MKKIYPYIPAVVFFGLLFGFLFYYLQIYPQRNREIPLGVAKTADQLIDEIISSKNRVDKADFKADRIVELSSSIIKSYLDEKSGIQVEILGLEKIDKGIQLLVRGWKNGQQLGFGKDGSVEIERIRMYDMPVLVEDENGTIVREWDTIDGHQTKKLRYDPVAAIKQRLAQAIKVVGKTGTQIVIGKVGNTTSTFNPAAGAASPVDGTVADATSNSDAWADLIVKAGDYASPTGAAENPWRFIATASTDVWAQLYRAIVLFDVSAISGTDTIDSVTFSLAGNSKADTCADTPDMTVVTANPASNDNLVPGDFTKTTNNQLITALAYAGMTISNNFADMAFNAAGLTHVTTAIDDVAGIVKLGTKSADRDAASTTPTWGSSCDSQWDVDWADTAGTATDPLLTVVHSAAASAAKRRVIISTD